MSAATLYAYVSRGLLRSEATDGQRERRYRADDVARLKRRRAIGRKAASIAGNTLDFGTPVLESALTLIEDSRLYYRGVDATVLARSASLEEVARLLGNCEGTPFDAANLPPLGPSIRRAWLAAAPLAPVDRCLAMLPVVAAQDYRSWADDRPAMLEAGVRVLRLLTAAVTAAPPSAAPVHEQLSDAWRGASRLHAPIIRAALGAVGRPRIQRLGLRRPRGEASTGANLYGATMAGLAAINGPRHGGLTRRVATLFDAICGTAPTWRRISPVACATPVSSHSRLRPPALSRRRRPVAATLFAVLREAVPQSPELAFAERLAAAVERLIDRKANIDFTTVTVERVLGLPRDSALALFLLGRTVGWIAHALEQADQGALIRPRARYTGPPPAT